MSSHHDSRSFAELLNTSVSEHLSADDSYSPASSRRSGQRTTAGATPESNRALLEDFPECPPTEDISRLSAVLSQHSMHCRTHVVRRMSRTNRGGDLSSLTQATNDLIDDCHPRDSKASNGPHQTAPLQLIMYAIKLFRRGVISKDQATLVQDFCLDPTVNREQCDTMRATIEMSVDEDDRQLAMEMWVTNLEKAEARRMLRTKEFSDHRPHLPELSTVNLTSVPGSSGQSTRAPSPYCPSPAASSPANSAIYNHMAAGALQQQTLNWQQQQQQQQQNGVFHHVGGQHFGNYFATGMPGSYRPMHCASPAPASPQALFSGSQSALQQVESASVVNMSLASPNAGSPTPMADMSGIAGCQPAPELRRPQPSRLNPRAQSDSVSANEDVPLELMPMGTPPLPHSRSPSPTLPTPPGQSSIVFSAHHGQTGSQGMMGAQLRPLGTPSPPPGMMIHMHSPSHTVV